MNDTIGLLILALVILAVFLWIGVRHNQEDRALKQKIGEGLGLRRCADITQELTRQITSVRHLSQHQRVALRNVYFKSLPAGELYLFDLWESRSGYRGYLEECAFAVISLGKNLPQLSIFPRSRVPGKPGGGLSTLFTWALNPMETEIRIENPVFEEHYLLTGKDENAVRSALNPELIETLAKSQLLVLRANEHTFTVSAISPGDTRNKPDLDSVRVLFNQAIQISSLLFDRPG